MCIRDSIEYQSTPIQNKQTVDNNDVMNMLQLILEQQNIKFSEVKSGFDEQNSKSDKLSSDR